MLFINAGNRKEALASLWDSLALKLFRSWETGVWDMEALGSESGGKLALMLELISPWACGGSWGQGVFHCKLNWADITLLKLPSMNDFVKCANWRLRIKNTFCYTVPVYLLHGTSIVLDSAVCANLLPCQIFLLLDVELQVQQHSRTSGAYSTEWETKHPHSLTHLRP